MVLEDTVNAKAPQVTTTLVNASTVETPPAVVPPMDTSQVHANVPTTNASGPTEPDMSSTADRPSDAVASVPDNNASNGGSYTSTLPDIFDIDMDGPEPLTVGPWVAIDHLTLGARGQLPSGSMLSTWRVLKQFAQLLPSG